MLHCVGTAWTQKLSQSVLQQKGSASQTFFTHGSQERTSGCDAAPVWQNECAQLQVKLLVFGELSPVGQMVGSIAA